MELVGYNIRVYGILINDRKEVLLSKEHRFGKKFTKFPGGGHELGEGVADGLKREFQEELGIGISIDRHFYTTDFLQVSDFDESHQLISIYYKVSTQDIAKIRHGMDAIDLEENAAHTFVWKPIHLLQKEDVTYPIDQLVVEKIREEFR